MTDQNSDRQKQLIVRIASTANTTEKEAIRLWIEKLLAIRVSNLSSAQKAKQAITVTGSSHVVLPTVKMLAREIKRLTWDERSRKGRMGLGGAAVGLALFGGKGAGIAALGTAIGVPLWVVFGAGAMFLADLYEEITGQKPNPKTNYRATDVEPEEKK